MKTGPDDVEALSARSSPGFTGAIMDVAYEVARPGPNIAKKDAAVQRLGNLINATLTGANMLARKRVWMEVDARANRYGGLVVSEYRALKALAIRSPQFFDAIRIGRSVQYAIAEVPFVEAIEDMTERDPRLARGYLEVQRLYSNEHGFALAKSSEQVITEEVQSLITRSLQEGTGVKDVEKLISKMGDWSRAYGETVYRTNMGNGYASGRLQQAFSEELDEFLPALRRVPVGDGDTRRNHNFELVAYKRDPIWLKLGVPAGYNCRCQWELVDVIEMEREGIYVPVRASIPAGAHNDPGFDNRASFSVWGVAA